MVDLDAGQPCGLHVPDGAVVVAGNVGGEAPLQRPAVPTFFEFARARPHPLVTDREVDFALASFCNQMSMQGALIRRWPESSVGVRLCM